MDPSLSRRKFLGTSTVAAGATLGLGASMVSAKGPSTKRENVSQLEKLRVALIGTGGQGRFLLGRLMANPRIHLAALSDCNLKQISRAKKQVKHRVDEIQDFRKVLDDKDIDAVVIATSDHWHALMSILANQAGKDVYIEKPLALSIEEGQQMVKHARENKSIVQVGLMQRSGAMYHEIIDIIQSGKIGTVSEVKCWNLINRLNGRKRRKNIEQPTTIDWDMWIGPRKMRPYDPDIATSGFRYRWDFSGGNLTNRGTHTMDFILQAMKAKYPKRISAIGGKYVFKDKDDLRETPDTLNVLYDFEDWTLHYEAREANHRTQWPSGYGTVFYGSLGSLFVDRGGYRLLRERNKKGVTGEDRTFGTPGKGKVTGIHDLFDPHIENFVESIATRKLPVCDVEIGHRSTNMAHLGNIAYKTRQMIEWDGEKEVCKNSPEAQAMLSLSYREPWKLERI